MIHLIRTIPYSKDTAALYSNGQILYDYSKHKSLFDELSNNAKEVLKWN